MKYTLLFLLASLILSSCQLSSEKALAEANAKAEDTSVDGEGVIPPPSGTLNLAEGESLLASQSGLPSLVGELEKDSKNKKENKIDVVKSGDFVFRDAVGSLPSQRDLAIPPGTNSPPVGAQGVDETLDSSDDSIFEPRTPNP